MTNLVLGLDIGATYIRAAVADNSKILSQHATAWNTANDISEDISQLADLVQQVCSDIGSERPTNIYAALPALCLDGVVMQWPNRPHWQGLPAAELIATRLRMQCQIEEDSNSAAIALWQRRPNIEWQHGLVISAGTGIGGGLILNGRLWRGTQGWAGEIGHVVIDPNGPFCTCGRRGCVQAMTAGRHLALEAQRLGFTDVTALTDAAHSGNELAKQVLVTAGQLLGIAAANIANILALDGVIVTGGLLKAGDIWWQAVEEGFQKQYLHQGYRSIPIVCATWNHVLTAALQGCLLIARAEQHVR